MKVFDLENVLSEVPDGAEVKFKIAGGETLKMVMHMVKVTDGEYSITLLLES